MIPVAEAVEKIRAAMTPTEAQVVPLSEALGRVLAADVTARVKIGRAHV